MPRAYTEEEVREKFIDHINALVNHWNAAKGSTKEKLEGLAYSILVTIDGDACDLPHFKLVPCPHPDDKQHYIDNDEDYFPDEEEDISISGSLHEEFCKK